MDDPSLRRQSRVPDRVIVVCDNCTDDGTGTTIRASVLHEIARERGRTLPGRRGRYYDIDSVTKDDEITLAVKSLGWKCLAPPGCRTTTEVMPTWRALWTQPMRWQTGALSDLRRYGVTRVTAGYWVRQIARYLGITLSFAAVGQLGDPVRNIPALIAGVKSDRLLGLVWSMSARAAASTARTGTSRTSRGLSQPGAGP